jgi:hypothetical protein
VVACEGKIVPFLGHLGLWCFAVPRKCGENVVLVFAVLFAAYFTHLSPRNTIVLVVLVFAGHGTGVATQTDTAVN